MRDLNTNLKKRIVNYKKLSNFGFSKSGDVYVYKVPIENGEFEVQLFVSKDSAYSKVIDVENDIEYALVDIEDAVGEFVGRIRAEYERIINSFISKCTQKEVFKSKQSKQLIKYIDEKYGDQLEFLWEKYDDNAIWRCKVNNKWYATLFTVSGDKLGLDSKKTVEVTNVMFHKGRTSDIVNNKTIFPAYHMNKNSWITIKLDDEISMEMVFELVDNSYQLCTQKSNKKVSKEE